MEPQPGEVWVITDPQLGTESWQVIHPSDRPFIVTAISPGRIGWVNVGDDGHPHEGAYMRGQWDWAKHATRIWPGVPSWDELERSGQCPDDLRAKALAGAA